MTKTEFKQRKYQQIVWMRKGEPILAYPVRINKDGTATIQALHVDQSKTTHRVSLDKLY